jgi:DNA-binding IclR family transcriptional regulator
VRISIGSQEWRVIRLLDGARDVHVLSEVSGLPKAEVQRILCDLTEAGFLQRVEVQKVLHAHVATGLFAKEQAELDERLREEWTQVARFEGGVARVQVRTLSGRSAVVLASFRSGVGRGIQLPRATMTDLGLREGEDVHVRPVA